MCEQIKYYAVPESCEIRREPRWQTASQPKDFIELRRVNDVPVLGTVDASKECRHNPMIDELLDLTPTALERVSMKYD
jgi:hypothetical protein